MGTSRLYSLLTYMGALCIMVNGLVSTVIGTGLIVTGSDKLPWLFNSTIAGVLLGIAAYVGKAMFIEDAKKRQAFLAFNKAFEAFKALPEDQHTPETLAMIQASAELMSSLNGADHGNTNRH